MENKKLTAVQELIEWVKKERDNTHKIELFRPKLAQLDALEELFKSKLELEKEQIIEAHDSKFKVMDEKFEKGGLTVEYQSGLGYYNEKYGQK